MARYLATAMWSTQSDLINSLQEIKWYTQRQTETQTDGQTNRQREKQSEW
jgi:hypothetical protein